MPSSMLNIFCVIYKWEDQNVPLPSLYYNAAAWVRQKVRMKSKINATDRTGFNKTIDL